MNAFADIPRSADAGSPERAAFARSGVQDPKLADAFAIFTAAAESLERSYQQLQQEAGHLRSEREAARRMIALAEMSSVLAHEIRNPLGTMELVAELLANCDELNADATGWVKELQAGIRSLSATVNNVLRFHTLGAPVLARIRLAPLLRDATNFVRPLGDKAGVNVSLEESLGDTEISANSSELQQVIFNLAINAFQHTEAGGKLRICAGRERRPAGEFAVVNLSDTGRGIKPEHLSAHLRTRFHALGKVRVLGLAICRKIVQQHAGVLLCAQPSGTRHHLHHGVAGRMTPLLSKSVLVVDDEPGMRTALQANFQRAGLEGGNRRRRLGSDPQVRATPFPLVVTDMRMPDGDGLQVMRSVRTSAPETAVILLTAFGSVPEAVEAMHGRRLRLSHQTGILRPAAKLGEPGDAGCCGRRPPPRRPRTSRSSAASAALRETLERAPAGGAHRRRHPDRSRKRHRQGAAGAAAFIDASNRGARAVRGGELRGSSRNTCWKASSSATCAARSPEPSPPSRESSSWPTAERCCWTRSARCR